jgi:hypothetical protein
MIRTEGLSSAAFRFFESKKVGDDLNGIGTLSEIKGSADGKVITFKIGLESYQINKAIAKPRRYSNGSFSTNSAKFEKLISEWQASGAPAPVPAPPPPPIPTSAATIPVLRRQSLTTSASLRIAEPKVSPVAPARAGSVVTKAVAAIPTVAKDVPPRPPVSNSSIPVVAGRGSVPAMAGLGTKAPLAPQASGRSTLAVSPPRTPPIATGKTLTTAGLPSKAEARLVPRVKSQGEAKQSIRSASSLALSDLESSGLLAKKDLQFKDYETNNFNPLTKSSTTKTPPVKPIDEEIAQKIRERQLKISMNGFRRTSPIVKLKKAPIVKPKKPTKEIFAITPNSRLKVTNDVTEEKEEALNFDDFSAFVGRGATIENFDPEFGRLKHNRYEITSVAKTEGFEFRIIKNVEEQLVKLAENGDFSTDSGDITEAEFLELINHLSVEIQSELESRMPKSPSPIAAQNEPESRMQKSALSIAAQFKLESRREELATLRSALRSAYIAEEASTQFSQSLGGNAIGKLVIDSSFIATDEESKQQFLKRFFKDLSKEGIEISIFKTDPNDASMGLTLADFREEEGLSINVTDTLDDGSKNSLIIGKGGILTYKRPGVAYDLTLPLQNVNTSFLSTLFVRKMTQGLTSLVDMSKPKAPPIPVTQDNSVATSDNVADRDDGERASAKGTTEASQRKHDRLDLPTEVITKATREALASKLPSSNSEEPKQSEDSLVNMPHLPPIVTSQHRADVDQLSEFVSPASSIPISILSPISDGLKSSLFVPSSSPHPVKSKRFEFQYEVLKHSIHGEKVTVNYRSDRGDAKSQDEKQIDVWKEEVNAAAAVAKKLDDKYGLKDNETDNSIKSGLMRITYQASIVAGGIGGRDSQGNIIPCSRGTICVDQNGNFVGYRDRTTRIITDFSNETLAKGVEIGDKEFENGAEYAKHLLEKSESYFTPEAFAKIKTLGDNIPSFTFISKQFQDQAHLLEGKTGNKRRLTYYTPEGMGVALEMIRTGEKALKVGEDLQQKTSSYERSSDSNHDSSDQASMDERTSFQQRFGSKLLEKKKALQSKPESWEESVERSRESRTSIPTR